MEVKQKMLNLKDIVNRVYENNVPVAFEVNIPIEGPHGEPVNQRVWYEKLPVDEVTNPRGLAYKVLVTKYMSYLIWYQDRTYHLRL